MVTVYKMTGTFLAYRICFMLALVPVEVSTLIIHSAGERGLEEICKYKQGAIYYCHFLINAHKIKMSVYLSVC